MTLRSADMFRLEEMEKNVLVALDTAARVLDELAKVGGAEQQVVENLCRDFLETIKSTQQLLHEAVNNAVGERNIEANVYLAMTKAFISNHKLDAVLLHLQDIQETLQQSQTNTG